MKPVLMRLTFLILVYLILAACSSALNLGAQPAQRSATAPIAAVQATSAGLPQPTQAPAPLPLQLDHHPLYWFAPLPPQPLGDYDGSDDFMELFQPDADWATASSYLQVFKFYGGWVAHESSATDRQQAVSEIRRRGLGLAVELGPLFPDETCGQYIEGFAGEEALDTVIRIRDAGGELNFIALDEPYYWAHFYNGEQACQWTAEKIAADVGRFVEQAREIFPDVLVGDIEPVTGPADAAAYQIWLETFRAVNGYDLAFLHLDMDWSNPSWPDESIEMEGYGRELGIPIGIIYIGNPQEESDAGWLAVAGERVKRYELEVGGQPDHVIFQSWNDKPDHALPESRPNTYTWFVKTYFEDKSSLGFTPEMLADKLALNKSVRVSRFIPGNEGQFAVDGDAGTVWNSGDDAPQWIEIDLGQPYRVGEIRLLVSQYPEGHTGHRILGKGPGTGDAFVELAVVAGFTRDGEWLTAEGLWVGIQFVRVETLSSPSWVSWREIEISPVD